MYKCLYIHIIYLLTCSPDAGYVKGQLLVSGRLVRWRHLLREHSTGSWGCEAESPEIINPKS